MVPGIQTVPGSDGGGDLDSPRGWGFRRYWGLRQCRGFGHYWGRMVPGAQTALGAQDRLQAVWVGGKSP